MPTFTHGLSTNNYGPNKFIVSANAYEGTHTTIASAVAAASSFDTIIIRPGNYTENFTVDKHLSFYADTATFRDVVSTVTITGKITISTAVNASFSNIKFTTNSDYILVLSANGAAVTMLNCYINITNNNGFNLSGNGSTNLYFISCSSSIADTYALFTSTACTVFIKECYFADGTNVATNSIAGSLYIFNSKLSIPITIAQGGGIYCFSSNFGVNFTPYINKTWITNNDTTVGASFIEASSFYSGTATAITLGAGSVLNAVNTIVNSSNANAIGGTGTFNKANITFTGSSSTIAGTLTVNTFTTV